VRRALPLLLALPLLAAACGGDSHPTIETPGAARTFKLENFQPTGDVQPGRPTTLAFTIEQPSGKPLTKYVTGPGPHTGVHLIVVRDDLSEIIHRHPPVGPGGRVSEKIDFPTAGKYEVLVDAYPNLAGPLRNFQLRQNVDVGSAGTAAPIPPFRKTVEADGYTVSLSRNPRLRALRPSFFTVTVTDPDGKPATFTPWYGALAHAIFFREGSLDYFHTHICGESTPGCTSVLGNPNLASKNSKPGQLNIGVLLPAPGTWRLFLQLKPGAQVITAPFTLRAR
jgi:hypothetical protein